MKKYKNLHLIIPGMMLMGVAIGLRFREVAVGAIIGIGVGVVIYFAVHLIERRKKN